MARMSIDDKFLRDPRITQLAIDLHMSRWEAMGRLIAVFAVCYDLERDVVSAALIDHAADRPGFADAMFAVDLAVNTKRGLRIRGAGKRIEYLAPKREAGRQGGLKSGESRRNSAKQKRVATPEASEPFLNPPDPVPDPAPDPVPEDQISPSRAIPQSVPQPEPASVPAVSPPAPAREDIAGTQPAAESAPLAATSLGFCNQPQILQPTVGDRDVKPANVLQPAEATLRANPPPAPSSAFVPGDPRAIGRLAEAIYRRVSDARIAVAAELKLPAPLPLPLVTPGSRTRGFDELSARIREEGALAPAACDRVVENAVKQARAKRSIDWLGDRLFGDKAWGNARDGIDPSARSTASRGDQRSAPSMPTPPKFEREVERKRTPEEIAELAAMARHAAAVTDGRSAADLPTAELVKRFGDGQRAPPQSAFPDDPPDERKPRKAKSV